MAGGKVFWTLDERNLLEAGRWETGVEAEAWAGSQTLAEAWAWAEALGSSEDESPGSGEEQQIREPDVREPGHGWGRRFLEGAPCKLGWFPKTETPGDWQPLPLTGGKLADS